MQNPQPLHRFLTPALLTEVLQAMGYRVAEGHGPDGEPVLTSATSGLAFEVRFFNPLTPGRKGAPAGHAGEDKAEIASPGANAPHAAGWADAAFRAAFRVEGELPLGLVNAWNATHRFARLDITGEWLLLDMDVIALGGVLADNLRAHIEIWDRLIAELISYLRAELPKLAPRAEPVTEPKAPAARPDAFDAA